MNSKYYTNHICRFSIGACLLIIAGCMWIYPQYTIEPLSALAHITIAIVAIFSLFLWQKQITWKKQYGSYESIKTLLNNIIFELRGLYDNDKDNDGPDYYDGQPLEKTENYLRCFANQRPYFEKLLDEIKTTLCSFTEKKEVISSEEFSCFRELKKNILKIIFVAECGIRIDEYPRDEWPRHGMDPTILEEESNFYEKNSKILWDEEGTYIKQIEDNANKLLKELSESF